MSLSNKLRELRLQKGLSLRKLGELCNTDPSYLSRLEQGKVGFGPEIIQRLSKAFEVTIEEFTHQTNADDNIDRLYNQIYYYLSHPSPIDEKLRSLRKDLKSSHDGNHAYEDVVLAILGKLANLSIQEINYFYQVISLYSDMKAKSFIKT